MKEAIEIRQRANLSNNLIQLFRGKAYEKKVLELMRLSKRVFQGEYEYVTEQSNGECDFIDKETGDKFDAKLPFTKEQIELLTSGKKHEAELDEWIDLLRREAAELNIELLKNNQFDARNTSLYSVMKKQLEKDKNDENIIFFFPFPIVLDFPNSIFLQFASDLLDVLHNQLLKDGIIGNRKIVTIYPAAEKQSFSIRELGTSNIETVRYEGFSDFFEYEVIGFQLSELNEKG